MVKYLTDNPRLVRKFHLTKNGDLNSDNFIQKSRKKVWQKYSKDDELPIEMFERLRSKDQGKLDLDRNVHKYIK